MIMQASALQQEAATLRSARIEILSLYLVEKEKNLADISLWGHAMRGGQTSIRITYSHTHWPRACSSVSDSCGARAADFRCLLHKAPDQVTQVFELLGSKVPAELGHLAALGAELTSVVGDSLSADLEGGRMRTYSVEEEAAQALFKSYLFACEGVQRALLGLAGTR